MFLRWALRARHLWAPQTPLPAIENPKRLCSRHRLVQPRIVWRRGATRILNSLDAKVDVLSSNDKSRPNALGRQ